MFGIGWTELLVIVLVALIVFGPKDLPRAMRSAGAMMRTLNRVTGEYRRQFEQALREAERELEIEEMKKSVQAAIKEMPAGAKSTSQPSDQIDGNAPESTSAGPLRDAKRQPNSNEA
ncbi:Sec-independent protein translocase protein TatB [Sinorhizobium medicae]|uniref:Sec-independent protein translocase protein TatB n=1 Tax=Sinorhizobium medicae TaxID=110321 RepID=A0ABX4TGX6_9HYPH|nr:Sec-independent protein translocase protein TatB [Sinorhizobium medicae]PLT99480.1 twin arginine-targeting protein translocase TatB [Sinorhizobium medicae]PLU16675.1 twin arginine-targeting protein translocase TatB [Sinorhizobium medicae]PLU74771.1 twin arginine-targeting protein translocase TatB [Sinorhizobium medicae]